jgi:hypothetical protein
VANVAFSGEGKVAAGDLNTLETSAQIAPLGQPDGMGVDEVKRHRVYVSHLA